MKSLKDILLRMAKREVTIAVEVLQREGKIPIDISRCGKVDTMKLKRIHNLKDIPFSILKDKVVVIKDVEGNVYNSAKPPGTPTLWFSFDRYIPPMYVTNFNGEVPRITKLRICDSKGDVLILTEELLKFCNLEFYEEDLSDKKWEAEVEMFAGDMHIALDKLVPYPLQGYHKKVKLTIERVEE